jgi:hypothetical protein
MHPSLRSLVAGVVASLGVTGCANTPPLPEAPASPYDANVIIMLVRYTAKEACSCAFVMERDDAYCHAWVKASPTLASAELDRRTKRARAAALGVFLAEAQFVDNQVGCRLVTTP